VNRTVIACLWQGTDLPGYSKDKFGIEDVRQLARGVNRCVTDGRTIVLCDDYWYDKLRGLVEPNLSTLRFSRTHHGGWSPMLEAYSFALYFSESNRALAVGLDTVFVNNCDWLFDWDLSPVGLPLDPYASPQPCNAVAVFDKVGGNQVWQRYIKEAQNDMRNCMYMNLPSEMALLRMMYQEEGWMPLETRAKKILSYKKDIVKRGLDPRCADIIYFHGKPKLGDLPNSNTVKRIWLQ
jgi:hypothetical protein